MKRELQNKLFQKYPGLFAQKDLGPMHSLMCFGIETPDSWFDIIDQTCGLIQKYVDDSKIQQIEFAQVKEKFGSLRMYANLYDDTVEDIIDNATRLTEHICARCGSMNDVKSTVGWIEYLCRDCYSERKQS